MNRHELKCIIIKLSDASANSLAEMLRTLNSGLQIDLAANWGALKEQLTESPALLLYPSTKAGIHESKLVKILQQYSPDTVLVYVTPNTWLPLSQKQGSVEACSVTSQDASHLKQQLDFLLKYTVLKKRFRQCKHLLGIAELRSRWLVDYSREAIAYVLNDRHLYANISYLSLFGFDNEESVQNTPLSDLVAEDNQDLIQPFIANMAQKNRTTSKMLLSLIHTNGQEFRAEVRFIPSVFRRQRCLQIHIRPLLYPNRHRNHPEGDSMSDTNPWGQPSEAYKAKQQNLAKPEWISSADNDGDTKAYFRETLNLSGNQGSALFLSEPFVWLDGKKQISYEKLLQYVDSKDKRFALDWWNLNKTLRQSIQWQYNEQDHFVLIKLGNWLFNQAPQARQLLQLLKAQSKHTNSLMIAISVTQYRQYKQFADRLLPALRETGVHIAADDVLLHEAALESLIRVADAKFARTHIALGKSIVNENRLNRSAQELLEWLEEHRVNTIVQGVENVASMNLLSTTPVTYLQGAILERLSR